MKHMPSVTILRIMTRSWRRTMSDGEVYEAMKKRLALERFDVAAMDEDDRGKYEELKEFLRGLEEK
jgi:hypothetical protein